MKEHDNTSAAAMMQPLLFGFSISETDGNGFYLKEAGGGSTAITFEPIPVCAKDVLHFEPLSGCTARMFYYRGEIPAKLIHTYTYETESKAITFQRAEEERPVAGSVTIPSDGYLRILFHAGVNAFLPPRLDQICRLSFGTKKEDSSANQGRAACFSEEEKNCLDTIAGIKREKDAALVLLSDSHYSVGGGFEETACHIKALAERTHLQGLIHLGDLTDGLLPASWTKRYARRVIELLRETDLAVEIVTGNHDYNYFRNNPQVFSRRMCDQVYRNGIPGNHYRDLPREGLRLIFLESFLPGRKQRYGFDLGTLVALSLFLRQTPDGWKVLIFSHVPPAAAIHVWSDTIRLEGLMRALLQRFQKRSNGSLLGWLCGHNHADQIYYDYPCPVISVGCGKVEDFQEKKPVGSVTWPRQQHALSQDLWDILIVKPQEGTLHLVRFGAGEDRVVKKRAKENMSSG